MEPEIVVTCPVCGERTAIPEGSSCALCASEKCAKYLLLTPVLPGYRYVMTICKEKIYYWMVKKEATTFTDSCCNEEFIINTNHVIEVRNNQLIYGTVRKNPLPSNDELVEELRTSIFEDAKKIDELRTENCSLANRIDELENQLQIYKEKSFPRREQPINYNDLDYANKMEILEQRKEARRKRRELGLANEHAKEVEDIPKSEGVEIKNRGMDMEDATNEINRECGPSSFHRNGKFLCYSWDNTRMDQRWTNPFLAKKDIESAQELKSTAEKSPEKVNDQNNDVGQQKEHANDHTGNENSAQNEKEDRTNEKLEERRVKNRQKWGAPDLVKKVDEPNEELKTNSEKFPDGINDQNNDVSQLNEREELESIVKNVGLEINNQEPKDTVKDMENQNSAQNEKEDRKKKMIQTLEQMDKWRQDNKLNIKQVAIEFQKELKRSTENGLDKATEFKNNDVVQLKKEIDRLNARIVGDAAKYAEFERNMQMIANEKIQLLNQLVAVNSLCQTATLNGNRMVEQINALIMTNLNLAAAVPKNGEPYQMAVRKDNIGLAQASHTAPRNGPLLVPCDICGVVAPIPNGEWETCCSQNHCPGNGTLILAPVDPGYRIVRRVCKNVCKYSLVPISMKKIQCNCCKRDYNIVDTVVEIRNGQKVYKAILAVLAEDELRDYRQATEEKMTKLESDWKNEREEADELRIENAELLEIREKMEVDLKNLKDALIEAREDASKAWVERMMLESRRYELEDKIKILETELKKDREELVELRNQNVEREDIRDKLTSLEEENKKYSEELEQLRSEHTNDQISHMKLVQQTQEKVQNTILDAHTRSEERIENRISDDNIARLTEINKLLIKKIKEFQNGGN